MNLKNLSRPFVPLCLAFALVVVASPASAAWTVDGSHTEINFSINHFFTPVTGSFGEFEVDLTYDPDTPANSKVSAKIAVDSVDTGNEGRDKHLKTADFFDAENYPHITFESSSVEADGDNLVAHGTLTIKDESHDVDLAIELLGRKEIPEEMRQMLGGTQEVASFRATTAVDRGDYGVGTGNFAATLIIGGEVTIEILLEAHDK